MPLFEFAIKSALKQHDLDRVEGRIAAMNDAAPIVAKIRDAAIRPEYTRELAKWLGLDVETVTKAVGRGAKSSAPVARDAQQPQQTLPSRPTQPGRRDPVMVIEREALKCALQQPAIVTHWYESVEETAYTHPSAVALHQAIAGAGYPSEDVDGLAWIDAVLENCADDQVRNLVRELSVDPLPADAGQDVRYATSVIARLLELDASRRIEELKGRLQRTDDDPEAATEVMRDLMALEDYRRSLRANATGQTN